MEIPHGGPDGGPDIRVDFSTNAHPLGPNPFVRAAIEAADRTRYPDPAYTAQRAALGSFHRASLDRIIVGASASELIWRLTLAWRLGGGVRVETDEHTFGEYRRAALALGLAPGPATGSAQVPALHWICDPNNPDGEPRDETVRRALACGDPVVVDLAYQPFRALLSGSGEPPGSLGASWAGEVTQLWSPNKLHGLTGVRGAYAILPDRARAPIESSVLRGLAPSWVLGADGVGLLEAHADPRAQDFLRQSVEMLKAWKLELDRALDAAGWQRRPSELHYGLYRPPVPAVRLIAWLDHLRSHGIKVRDAASFGYPAWVRLRALEPAQVERLIGLTARFGCG
ncbi:MAG TPA: aminotransferase class I/II-fold pyridoxal phosphate-dependent enzyme [Steroidobacteraceae bacterium]|jgi:histidinol-phosphate aminotransferase|nr:aminotransferase class I/II-fold pyridoxal phosphate-dependent enzyme [Steroidobacteraceae bacterium]